MSMYTSAAPKFVRSALSVLVAAALFGANALHAQPAGANSPELQELSRLVRAGQHGAAIEKANAFLATKPKDALARFLKGVALTETGKTNDAIAVFQSITEDNPELPEPYNNLAVLYASKGQFEKARTALELAIQTHPSYSTAHENLGDVYAKLASQAYDRALQLDRGNSAVQGKLGLIKDLFSTQPKASQKPDAAKVAALVKPAESTPKAADPAPTRVAAAPVAATTPAPAPFPAASTVTPVAPSATPAAARATPPAAAPAPTQVVTSMPGAAPAVAVAAAAPKAAPASPAEPDAVMAAVKNWARVWSNRDAEGYVSAYATAFKPEDGRSRRAWEAERRDRVSSPSFIKVELVDPVVVMAGDGTAEVKFRQQYTSDRLQNHSVRKTLSLVKTASGWQITRERNG
jgi:tetratricopeptide (TPR) repeat protein